MTDQCKAIGTIQNSALGIPGTGEVMDLANPEDATLAWLRLDELEREVRWAKQIVKGFLVQHARDGGGLTMRTATGEVRVREQVDISWNLSVLEELRAVGLPDARWRELVTQTVTSKVSAATAKQIAKAKPEYADIISRAEKRTEKPETVSVSARVVEELSHDDGFGSVPAFATSEPSDDGATRTFAG